MSDRVSENAVLDFHLEFINGLVNGSTPNSPVEQPDVHEAFVTFCDAFTEDGYEPELEVDSKLEIANGQFTGIIDANFTKYSIYLNDFRSPDHPDFEGSKLHFESEIRIDDPSHLAIHMHDEKSFALLTVLQEMFVMLQFGETFDEIPLVDWELTRAVCQYLQSELSIHLACVENCDLRQLAEKNFLDFDDLELPLKPFDRHGAAGRPYHCPECTNPVFVRSIVKQPNPNLRGILEEFPSIPEFGMDEPTMFCWECGWERH